MHSHARKLIVRYPAARMLAQLHTETCEADTDFCRSDEPSMVPVPAMSVHDLPSPAGNEAIDVGPLRTITRSQSTLHICLQFFATPFRD